MKLLTKKIEEKLQYQYQFEDVMAKQKIQAKLFLGSFTWYVMNQDPSDPDYIWCIVKNGDIVEVGSASVKELESIRARGVFPVERDKFFTPLNAKEAYSRLVKGEHI